MNDRRLREQDHRSSATVSRAGCPSVRGRPLRIALLLCVLAGCSSTHEPPHPRGGSASPSRLHHRSERPNILLILLDDAHFESFRATGHPTIRTPHIDEIAAHGIVFRQALTPTPLCSPSQISLLTGHFSHQHGVRLNPQFLRKLLSPSVPTVVQRLSDSGYATGLFGKSHLSVSPAAVGFKKHRVFCEKWGPKECDTEHVMVDVEARRRPELLTSEVVGYLQGRKQERPFFLWVAFRVPHYPLLPLEEYLSDYEGIPYGDLVPPSHAPSGSAVATQRWQRYAAVMSQVDHAIGQITHTLEQTGELDKTAIFLTADNGFNYGAHDSFGKILAWEDSIRVPLVATIPGIAPSAPVSDAPVSIIDLPATWMDLAGLDNTSDLHGDSLRDLFLSDQAWRDTAFAEFDAKFGPNTAYRLVRNSSYKLISFRDGRLDLFDLSRDPYEETNLAGSPEYGIIRDRLLDEMRRWMLRTGDPAMGWPGPSGQRFNDVDGVPVSLIASEIELNSAR